MIQLLLILTDYINKHAVIIQYAFPANQVMKYFHVFISLHMAICLASVCVMASNQAIRIITSACQVPSFGPRKSCPTAISRMANSVDIM